MPDHDETVTPPRTRVPHAAGGRPAPPPGRISSGLGGVTDPEPAVLRVLVDDVRDFKDGRSAVVLRTSREAVDYVARLGDRRIDELWLDHDLVGDDTVQPLVGHLVAAAASGRPVPVDRNLVHSSNIRAGHRVVQELAAAGYRVERSFAANLWRHTW